MLDTAVAAVAAVPRGLALVARFLGAVGVGSAGGGGESGISITSESDGAAVGARVGARVARFLLFDAACMISREPLSHRRG